MPFRRIVTRNPGMLGLLARAAALAPTDRPLLITGETGTGKTLLARAIHDASGRPGPLARICTVGLRARDFIRLVLGGLEGGPGGALREAARGSLFLDEIGAASARFQEGLVELLDNRTGSESAPRLILSTNLALDEPGGRTLLAPRLMGLVEHIHVPPLRERLDDLPALLEHFLRSAPGVRADERLACRRDILDILSSYPFPGNVQELRSMLIEAVCKRTSADLPLRPFVDRVEMHRDVCRHDR